MWAMIEQAEYDRSLVLTARAQPGGDRLVVVDPNHPSEAADATPEALLSYAEAEMRDFTERHGLKFDPARIQTWHARPVPGHGVVVRRESWEQGASLVGKDHVVFVFQVSAADWKAQYKRRAPQAAAT